MFWEKFCLEFCDQTYNEFGIGDLYDISPKAVAKQNRINEINKGIGLFIQDNEELVNQIYVIFRTRIFL